MYLETERTVIRGFHSEKSVGLMEKLGMQLEGVQRRQTRDDRGSLTDLYLYGILKEDYTVF